MCGLWGFPWKARVQVWLHDLPVERQLQVASAPEREREMKCDIKDPRGEALFIPQSSSPGSCSESFNHGKHFKNMLQRGLHVVSNDECLLLHSVRVTRAETDTVLCSEVMHLSYNGKRLHPRYRHKLQCNQLAFTWEKHTHYINKHSLLYTGGKASFEVFEQIHLRQKCPSPGSCHTPQ